MKKKAKIILVAGARPNFMNPVRDYIEVYWHRYMLRGESDVQV